MSCGDRLLTLKGIDTDFGEIIKTLDEITALGINCCLKPTLVRQSCLLESQTESFRLRAVYDRDAVNNFDSMCFSTTNYDRLNTHYVM